MDGAESRDAHTAGAADAFGKREGAGGEILDREKLRKKRILPHLQSTFLCTLVSMSPRQLGRRVDQLSLNGIKGPKLRGSPAWCVEGLGGLNPRAGCPV